MRSFLICQVNNALIDTNRFAPSPIAAIVTPILVLACAKPYERNAPCRNDYQIFTSMPTQSVWQCNGEKLKGCNYSRRDKCCEIGSEVKSERLRWVFML